LQRNALCASLAKTDIKQKIAQNASNGIAQIVASQSPAYKTQTATHCRHHLDTKSNRG
jgi:hypothetical protein